MPQLALTSMAEWAWPLDSLSRPWGVREGSQRHTVRPAMKMQALSLNPTKQEKQQMTAGS